MRLCDLRKECTRRGVCGAYRLNQESLKELFSSLEKADALGLSFTSATPREIHDIVDTIELLREEVRREFNTMKTQSFLPTPREESFESLSLKVSRQKNRWFIAGNDMLMEALRWGHRKGLKDSVHLRAMLEVFRRHDRRCRSQHRPSFRWPSWLNLSRLPSCRCDHHVTSELMCHMLQMGHRHFETLSPVAAETLEETHNVCLKPSHAEIIFRDTDSYCVHVDGFECIIQCMAHALTLAKRGKITPTEEWAIMLTLLLKEEAEAIISQLPS